MAIYRMGVKSLSYLSYPSVFWPIGITLKESGVNFRGHINSHEGGIRGRTMIVIYTIVVSNKKIL